MKHLMKRGFALLMALIMVLGLLPAMSFAVAAEESIVNYQYAYVNDTYSNVIKNWGTRGELATFLSPNAEAFYAETSLEELAALSGSADTATVHTSALYEALHQLMAHAHATTTSYDATRALYQYTDSQKNGAETTKISAFYSGALIGPEWDGGQTWNREHTWPDSKGGNGTHENDIMMLRPEAGNVNSSRNNKAYGISEGFFDPNTSTYNLHGDVARIMLYTFVRWGGVTEGAEDGTASYTNQTLLDNMWGTDGVIESLEVLLAWAEEDPVDTWEMARNDSVQSITGTRNVFVDYPELVFELFEEEVPAGYDTPSGSANAVDFAITATVTNPEGGEVSVNGDHVTVHPYAGYQLSSIKFSEGTTYTQNSNVFTVTSTADCTVTVSFAELDSYTVTVKQNGNIVDTAEVSDGNIYRLPDFSGELPEGYAFRGWVTNTKEPSAVKPSVIHAAGDEMPIDDDITYYALLTYLNAGDQSNAVLTYELVDSADDLKIGSSYVITGTETAKALSTTQNGNNRGAVDITKSNNVLVFDETAGVAELTLGEGYTAEDTGSSEETSNSIKYIFSQYAAGDQYAVDEVHKLDDVVTVTTTQCHFTSDLRIYSSSSHNGYAVISSASAIKSITLNAGNKADTLNIYGSTDDGATWTLIGGLATATGYKDLTLDMPEGSSYKLLKLDVAGSNQVRVMNMVLTFAEAVDAGSSDTEDTAPQYSFYDAANSGYIYAASGSSNYMRTQETLDANGSFEITVNTDGSVTMTAKGANARNTIAYNSSQNLFSCYTASNTMEKVSLYVGVPGVGTMYYTTSWDSDWEGDIDPTDPPTTEPEVTEPEVTEPEVTEPEVTEPAGIEGRYYIATIRSSGNYFYMTSNLGAASTKRYTAVDSGLTALPASITEPQDGYVFVVEKNEDDTYSIYAEGVDGNNYLGWTSGNSGTLVAAASAVKATVDKTENGYNIHFAASDAERYLALNGTASNNYFAWYKSGQKQDLTLIPVVTDSTEPTEPEVTEPESTEPEVTEPEATVPYVTAPEVGTAYHLVVAQNNTSVNKILYATGAMDGYYLATSATAAEAVEVYVEAADGVEGGYRLYFMDGETKTYIRIYERSATSGGVALVTSAPAEYLTYNGTYNTFFYTGSTQDFYLGTYNTYETMSVSRASYMNESNVDVSQFPARLYPVPTEEVVVTAQDGLNKLVDSIVNFHNGTVLASSVSVGDVTMDVEWSVKADENAVKIEDGKLILTPQADEVFYSLSVTVYNGADDSASTVWQSLKVVAISDVIADGSYVIWTADGNAMTTIDSGYGYFAPTKGVTLTDGVLSGYVNENLFTFTANGDGTYSIVDNNGNYLYSDMSYSYSKQFNVAGTKPESGADWTLVANEDGTYYINNVDHSGGIGYDTSYGNFGMYRDLPDSAEGTTKPTALNLTAATQIEEIVDPNTLTYVFKNYPKGEQYAENEVHVLDDVVSVVMNDGHFTEQLRIYDSASNNSTAIIKSTKDVNKIVLNAGYSIASLQIYASTYGQQWVLIDTISTTATYTDYTVTMPEDTIYGYIKLDAVGAQVRVAEMSVTLGDEIPACEHGEIVEDEAVAPSLSAAGLTAGSHCAICGEVMVAQDEIPCLVDVEAWNLTLGSDLSVNFLLNIHASVKETAAEVVITVGETNVTYPVKDSADDLFTVHVAAAQMNDAITVQVVNGDDSSSVWTYTVLEYAQAVLANSEMSAYHPMVEAMLQYGASAQTFFAHNTENLVNADREDTVTNEIPAADGYSVAQKGAVEGLSFYGASMVHKNKIGIRYYFNVTGDVSTYTFKVGETAYEPVVKTNNDGTVQCYVEVGNINIADLDEAVTLTVADASGEASVTYGPMHYITRQYSNTAKENLKALLQQLYDYYMAAESYLAANAQ